MAIAQQVSFLHIKRLKTYVVIDGIFDPTGELEPRSADGGLWSVADWRLDVERNG